MKMPAVPPGGLDDARKQPGAKGRRGLAPRSTLEHLTRAPVAITLLVTVHPRREPPEGKARTTTALPEGSSTSDSDGLRRGVSTPSGATQGSAHCGALYDSPPLLSGWICPKADRFHAFARTPCRCRRPHSAIEWERFCSYADRRSVILSGPQAAFRLRAEVPERAMLMKEKMKCSATS